MVHSVKTHVWGTVGTTVAQSVILHVEQLVSIMVVMETALVDVVYPLVKVLVGGGALYNVVLDA